MLGLRFAIRLFEQVWSAEHIERVDIVFDETLGLEGRAGMALTSMVPRQVWTPTIRNGASPTRAAHFPKLCGGFRKSNLTRCTNLHIPRRH
ncbi:hypothetical protein KIV56_02545 [Cryobacterium breve]|uniref:Glucose-6-phosphate dehydrogenase C-terminal domain-containing protein n=1 Tax=Cryobacterium breve TaxID=1259258 RepID=A0ABY7NFR3_9MICO|nr:hypothetical protein KIV56_02545 [Cryobacterium breve]